MKKIIIVTKKMIIGGIEQSLIKMLKNQSEDQLDITLVILEKGGELETKIPKNINVKYIMDDTFSIKSLSIKYIKKGHMIKFCKTLIYGIISSKSLDICKSYEYLSKILCRDNLEYDLAIAYHTLISLPVIYVINNIKSRKKIMWIHSDINRYVEHINPYKKYYKKYDGLFSVSKDSKNNLVKNF